jgi:hypothetical protein
MEIAMPVIDRSNAAALPAAAYDAGATPRWRPMFRIDEVGGNVQAITSALLSAPFERSVYVEGDSWFDKFTPIPRAGTNLVEAIRTPFFTAAVDVSHIGDTAAEMVRGHQRQQTEALFKLIGFDAILYSGGGNDLKNLFAELYEHRARGSAPQSLAGMVAQLEDPRSDAFFDGVIAAIREFVALRDACPNARTRAAPILMHGYDFLQPRPAAGAVFGDALKVAGPWLYPSMKAAGLSDMRMAVMTRLVIDELNVRLQREIATLANVYVIDQRGLLEPAAAGSSGESGHWLDEIHPNAAGFERLTRNRWDVTLSSLLGWAPAAGQLQPPADALS